jgi:hypothetical protein
MEGGEGGFGLDNLHSVVGCDDRVVCVD